jgi:hypothetical protein
MDTAKPAKFPRSKYKRLSAKEKALVINLSKGMTLTDAARASGYTTKAPGQAGYQAYHVVKAKFPELLEKHGLTDDSLIEKYLKPGLEACETKFAQNEGQFTDERNVIAWSIRHNYLETTLKLRGAFDSAQNGNGSVNISAENLQIVNFIPRPERGEKQLEPANDSDGQ